MDIFRDYAGFYDALYSDKDYETECDFVESLWKEYCTFPVKSLLDLGCGTGGHALILAERGYEVTGIDISEEMLKQAKKKAKNKNLRTRFKKCDIRNFSLNEKYDAAIAMFDVMGYINADEDIIEILCRVKSHLKPRGLFIFDVWFGPGVLRDLPTQREKTIKTRNRHFKRIAEPELDIMNQIVKVRYTIIENKKRTVYEIHPMRFFFPREIEFLINSSRMKVHKITSFPEKNSAPSISSWRVTCVVSRK